MTHCPRCGDAVRLETWRVPSPTGEVELSGCATCRGLFVQKSQLASVCPTVSHLPDHLDEVVLTGQPGAGIARCPSCAAVPYQVELIGVAVDFCVRCCGVWLDGADYQEAAFESRRSPRAADPYRSSANELVGAAKAERCVYCERDFPPNELGFWELGRICNVCKAKRDLRVVQRDIKERAANQSWLELLFEAIARP